MNQVNLIGRLGADPEVRAMPSGESVANLRLATTERWKNQAGEQQERTEWHRIAVFGKVADVFAEHCRKGQELALLNLQLRTRKWQDKDGQDRYTTELHFTPKSGFEFLRRPAADGETRAPSDRGGQQELPGTNTGGRPSMPSSGYGQPNTGQSTSSPDDLDDDIPF